MEPKVVVGTLTWNQKADVLECLDSLVKLEYPNYEIVVVDNGSTDGTAAAVRELYPQVAMVRNASNLGCAEGVNGEIRHAIQAQADYLFIIANDAVVEPSTLTELIRVAKQNPQLGMVFPKVYYYGTNRIWFARGMNLDTDVDWLQGCFRGYIQNVEDGGVADEEKEADLYPGGFCLVNMNAVRTVGLLDPRYFIYFDDTEWLTRLARAGFRGRYAPRAKAWHKASSAFGMESATFYYYRTRNRLYFYRQFSPPGFFPRFFLRFLREFLIKRGPRLYRSQAYAQLRASLWGLADFLKGKMGSRDFSEKKDKQESSGILRRVHKIQDDLHFAVRKLTGRNLSLRVSLEWNLGDEILSLPIFEVLRKKYPGARIEARVNFPGLLQGNPFVDQINGFADSRPDLVLDFRHEERGKPRMNYLKSRLKTGELPLPKVYLDPAEISQIRRQHAFEDGRLVVAVSSSARWFSRRWEREKWVVLIRFLEDKYGARVLVLGTTGEELPAGEDLTGRTNVREAALILSQCHLFVGADSGLVHLAVSVGTPTIGLYGPLNPDYLISPRPTFHPVWSEVECRGCWSDTRMKYPDHCPKIVPDCMSSIPAERVFEKVANILGAAGFIPKPGQNAARNF